VSRRHAREQARERRGARGYSQRVDRGAADFKPKPSPDAVETFAAKGAFIARDGPVHPLLRVSPRTCREYFARSFGAITHEQNGAKIKLNKMTIGSRIEACSDKRGIERTIVAPIPNNTALTIMLNSSDIENLVDIGRRLRRAMPVSGAR
jgi:hypothetical protein